jgi:hypothetical protein
LHSHKKKKIKIKKKNDQLGDAPFIELFNRDNGVSNGKYSARYPFIRFNHRVKVYLLARNPSRFGSKIA